MKFDIYPFLRPLLFSLNAELAHEVGLKFLRLFPHIASVFPRCKIPAVPIRVGGIEIHRPVGIAAGFDKNGVLLPFFARLNIPWVEVGTVTLLPQEGNSKPRLFRNPQEAAIANRMGFNSLGAKVVLKNIQHFRNQYPKDGNLPIKVGVNIGKNKNTPLDHAYEDYLALAEIFAPVADYLCINLSSPNTPNLRQLQNTAFITQLSDGLSKFSIPLWLKLAPDLSDESLIEIFQALTNSHFKAVVMGNTSNQIPVKWGEGGVSGRPLYSVSEPKRTLLLKLSKESLSQVDIIGAGGFENPEQVISFLKLGGAAVQIYSSFIFQGPSLFCKIFSQLDALDVQMR